MLGIYKGTQVLDTDQHLSDSVNGRIIEQGGRAQVKSIVSGV